ncbi:hypothetical protein VTN00DRAFT_349 [Thermoascus crustaceus]|uniref:uncharacterized protein n=1 Tax=Thermoascus crustaceus TaxID=5088 RepID=UPI0037434775
MAADNGASARVQVAYISSVDSSRTGLPSSVPVVRGNVTCVSPLLLPQAPFTGPANGLSPAHAKRSGLSRGTNRRDDPTAR